MVPFLGLNSFNPTAMNQLVGWTDDLHLALLSLLALPIGDGLEAADHQMQVEGVLAQYGSPMEMDLESLARTAFDLRNNGLIDIAGELQKVIFRAQLYDHYRLVDGRDQVEMDFWTSAIVDDSASPLFLSMQANLDRIDNLTPSEALEAEDFFAENQIEAIDVLHSLPQAEIERYEAPLLPLRQVGAVRRLKSRRRGIFPTLAEVKKHSSMDDLYTALLAHGQGQIAQIGEIEEQRGFTKPTFNALLVGDRGVGKSSIIASIFNELGLRYAIFNAATMDPYLDLVGLPYVEETEGGERVSRTALPLNLSQGLDAIFIDELNRASMPVQNALMQIILEGKVNDQTIPGLKLVWAAINPPQTGSKNYGVQSLNWALEGRFTIYQLPNDVSEKYFMSRQDLLDAFGPVVMQQILGWWRDFQKDENISPDEKAYLDPRTLDNLLTQVAGAKRRNEQLLIGAIAKSLGKYPAVLDGLNVLLAVETTTLDLMLDVMEALNEDPKDLALVSEFSNILRDDPEGAKTVFNNITRFLYPSIVEKLEEVEAASLLESEYFNAEEVATILYGFFAQPGNTFFAIWANQEENTFENIVNQYYALLSQEAIGLEERGPQLLAPIRSMYRLEALLINSALAYIEEGPEQKSSLKDLIFKIMDPSVLETDIAIEELSDLEALIKTLAELPLPDEFADPVATAKRNLLRTLAQFHFGKFPLEPLLLQSQQALVTNN